MRLTPWFLVVVTLFLAPPAFAAPKEGADGGDEQTLQMAGLSTDGPALVDFFRHRAHTEADGEHLRDLVHKLSDPATAVRDRSAAELVGWGPLAVPALRQAVNDIDDQEAANRARKCLQYIEGASSANLPAAAARLLAVRKPAGAADALLAYLPVADNKAVLDEVAAALRAVAYPSGKPDAGLLRALKDSMSVRRAAAGMALYRTDQPEQWPAVRKLLQDPKPTVRLRAAMTLAKEQDAEAIGVLIELLADLSLEDRKEAEAILQDLAGDWAPGPVNGEDEIARRIRRDTWAAWWKNTDGPALVAALKKRTLTPENQKKVVALIKKLGDDDFDTRERAQSELVSMGRLTLPLLQEAAKDKDAEVSRRASECVALIEKDTGNLLPSAVFKLLAVRRPAGGAEALLDYLPYIDNDAQIGEAQTALIALALRDGKPDPALLEALQDKVVLRRSSAGQALARGAGADARAAVRKLLKDKEPAVRLHVAIALVTARDKESMPALIDMIADLPDDLAGEAHAFLYQLAGDKSPEMVPADSEEARKKNRDAWAAWWKDNADKVDFAKLDGKEERFLGYTLLIHHGNNRIAELGPDNKERWHIENLPNPIDAVVVPGNHVLIAEYSGQKVTERDFTGKVLWEKGSLPGNPTNVQRLKNGNTFIATTATVMEVDRTGKVVYQLNNFPNGLSGGCKTRDGHVWVLSNDGRCVCLDTTGKELKSAPMPNGFGIAGIEPLPGGGVLVSQPNNQRVVELDADGKTVWEAQAQQVMTATRLPNGNVLAASYNAVRVFEIDRKGKVVWEYKDMYNVWRARRR